MVAPAKYTADGAGIFDAIGNGEKYLICN